MPPPAPVTIATRPSKVMSLKVVPPCQGCSARILPQPRERRLTGSYLPAVSIRVEDDGPVRVVVIDRPEARGAVDGEHAAALLAAFEELEARDDLSVGVLTGSGGHFCSGADLKAVSAAAMPVFEYGEGPGPMGPSRLRLSK